MEDPSGYLFIAAMNLFRKRYRRSKLAALLPVGHAARRRGLRHGR